MDKKKIRFAFYFIWLILGLVQANFSELINDEAYYWRYSENLAWGYFDHPPVVALLIKPGHAILRNELGVRLLFVFTSVLFIFLVEKLTKPENLYLFYSIIFSFAVLHFGSFMAVPDVPLLAATALFFLIFRGYLFNNSWRKAFFLSLAIAFLLYSKYQGVLVIIFTLLANLALMKRKTFWFISVFSFLLFVPHLYWQFVHRWPTLNYHLYQRSIEIYRLSYTTDYFWEQLTLLLPFTGLFLLFFSIFFKPRDQFEKTLKFNLFATYIFFFLMTFKGSVESNWTIILFVPLIYCGYFGIRNHLKIRRLFFYTVPISIVIILIGRFFLIFDYLPERVDFKTQFHQWEQWANDIKQVAGSHPVVFVNSYQDAAKYEFYAGEKALSLSNVLYKRSQYDLWNVEDQLQGDTVIFLPNWKIDEARKVKTPLGTFPYVFIGNFRSYSKVKVFTEKHEFTVKPEETFNIKIRLKNEFEQPIDFCANQDFSSSIGYYIYEGNKPVKEINNIIWLRNNSLDNWMDLPITAPEKEGKYNLRIGIKTGWFPPYLNSNLLTLIVRN